jgi:hypothetical protein
MDIIDGKKKSVAAAAPIASASTPHEDLDSASFFGAKSSSRNRAQKSMLRYARVADQQPPYHGCNL